MERRMLLLVYRDDFEERIRDLLDELDVRAFTEVPRLLGGGETGRAEESHAWPGFNRALFTVLAPDRLLTVLTALRGLIREEETKRKGPVGIRGFTLPADLVL